MSKSVTIWIGPRHTVQVAIPGDLTEACTNCEEGKVYVVKRQHEYDEAEQACEECEGQGIREVEGVEICPACNGGTFARERCAVCCGNAWVIPEPEIGPA